MTFKRHTISPVDERKFRFLFSAYQCYGQTMGPLRYISFACFSRRYCKTSKNNTRMKVRHILGTRIPYVRLTGPLKSETHKKSGNKIRQTETDIKASSTTTDFLAIIVSAQKSRKDFFKNVGFTPCKAEQPLRGMELQEKEAQKD